MDTIRNYLEQMFISYPKSKEVIKAKEELFQMMEDKYHELKGQGKSENEAIGTVISEFGNIQELMEDLGYSGNGIQKEDPFAEEMDFEDKAERRIISVKDAMEYMGQLKRHAKMLTLATMLCIYSPISLIFYGGLAEASTSSLTENIAGFIGMTALFLFIIAAIPIFIYTSNKMEKYKYLKKGLFGMDSATQNYLAELEEKEKSSYSMRIIIGVILCIISVLPLISFSFLQEDNEMALITGICTLIFIVGLSMLFFIPAETVHEGYHILLKKGEYRRKAKDAKKGALQTAYWCIVTSIYLAWSFWTYDWHMTWIIWPVAAVLSGAVSAIYDALGKNV